MAEESTEVGSAQSDLDNTPLEELTDEQVNELAERAALAGITSDDALEETEATTETTEESEEQDLDPKDVQIDELSKKIEGLQSLIGKWSNEIGDLRKAQANQGLSNTDLEDADDEDLVTMKDLKAATKAREQAMAAEAERERQARELAPQIDEYRDDFYAEIKRDLPEDFDGSLPDINTILRTEDPVLVRGYFERAKLQRVIKDLQAKNEAMTKKHSGLISKITSRKKNGFSGRTPMSNTNAKNFDTQSLASMSDEELDALIEANTN